MSNHEELQQDIKKLPEGSKAEQIRNDVEAKLAEITTTISEGHPSLTRLELQKVGQNILTLFDEILEELPDNMEADAITRPVTDEDLEQGGAVIGSNRSQRFWEIDSEIGELLKKFEALYEQQANEPEIHTDGFLVNPDQPSVN